MKSTKSYGLPIVGIVDVGADVYMLQRENDKISIFDPVDFNFKRHLTVAGIVDARSLVACQRDHCLYIADARPQRIRRVNLSTGKVSQWYVDDEPTGLSVTRKYNLLVTLCQSNKIQEYTAEGHWIREIKLDVSMDRPQHSVEMPSGRPLIVVSHAGTVKHRVCVVDNDGAIVYSCGGNVGLSIGQFNHPGHLDVDSQGNVLVSDCKNDRVLLLSATLTYLGCVSTPGYSLRHPYALHLDQLNGRLYVGEWAGGLIVLEAPNQSRCPAVAQRPVLLSQPVDSAVPGIAQ